MSLHRLIYRSTSRIKVALLAELSDIVSASIANNTRNGMTGALVYADGRFVQTLEGERATLFATYQRIVADARHGDATLLSFNPVPARFFADWSMGIATRNPQTARFFAPFLRQARFDPDSMAIGDVQSLMTALATHGLHTTVTSGSGLG